VRDTGERVLLHLDGGRGYLFRILPRVGDAGEPGLPHLEWRARIYSGYSPVLETPVCQGYLTWSGGRGYLYSGYSPLCETPGSQGYCYLEWRAKIYFGYSVRDTREPGLVLPGVEGEDIFRILPGVRDTGEP
jgi:hypothetical protein